MQNSNRIHSNAHRPNVILSDLYKTAQKVIAEASVHNSIKYLTLLLVTIRIAGSNSSAGIVESALNPTTLTKAPITVTAAYKNRVG